MYQDFRWIAYCNKLPGLPTFRRLATLIHLSTILLSSSVKVANLWKVGNLSPQLQPRNRSNTPQVLYGFLYTSQHFQTILLLHLLEVKFVDLK